MRNYRRLVLLACLAPVELLGTTLYSNLGPGQTFDNSTSFVIGPGTYSGVKFVASASGNLGDILVAIYANIGQSPTFALYADSGGQPGTQLETWTVPTALFPSLTTLTSVLEPLLSAGTQYWFGVSPNISWYLDNQGVLGGIWNGSSPTVLPSNVAGDPTPAIQLDAATPEPGSGELLALGLLVALCARSVRGRQRA